MINTSVGFFTSLVVTSLTEGCVNMLWTKALLLMNIPSGLFTYHFTSDGVGAGVGECCSACYSEF